ncbi:hypothetical protein [Sphingobium sp. YBL2]|uniref:hypothetical protein n=1 Tax=Sphingobium sp. (strain YBL2) TaxID=484429 RepID=UPI0005CC14E1|nr:hypothetical protein [Sphingobium sp. YBL2]AJR24536.1 hypothetical protein TZ53_13180 [Sphingobium sp. YBL2]
MSHKSYAVGSSFAQALSRADAILRDAGPMRLRPVDFVNAARFCAEEAHAALQRDPARARELLINGASRMLAVAEMLERPAEPAGAADVIPFPARGRRPILRAVQ